MGILPRPPSRGLQADYRALAVPGGPGMDTGSGAIFYLEMLVDHQDRPAAERAELS